MTIDKDKIRAAAMAALNSSNENFYAHVHEYLEEQANTVLSLLDALDEAEKDRDALIAWQEAVFEAHPNIDIDISSVKGGE